MYPRQLQQLLTRNNQLFYFEELKYQESRFPRKNQNKKFIITWQKSKAQTLITYGERCYISYLVQAFPYVENGGINVALKLAKYITCLT